MQIKTGDIFQLGDHRLTCGDAKDPALIKKLISDERVSLILSDPPYGVAYVEGKAGLTKIRSTKKIANDHNQTEEVYRQFTREWLEVIKPYLSKKNSFYIFNCKIRKRRFEKRHGTRCR